MANIMDGANGPSEDSPEMVDDSNQFYSCPPLPIRMPGKVRSRCLMDKCERFVFSADAHWICTPCQKLKAPCVEGCLACKAMEEVEWRKKALIIAKAKRTSHSTGFHDPRIKMSVKSIVRRRKRKRSGSDSPPRRKVRRIKKAACAVRREYLQHIEELEFFLFGYLDPSLPDNVACEEGLSLPQIPHEMSEEYNKNKLELTRLLASATVCLYLEEGTTPSNSPATSLLQPLIIYKANCVAENMLAIRKFLLKGLHCSETDVLEQLKSGDIRVGMSLFGHIRNCVKPVKLSRIKTQPDGAISPEH